MTFLKTLTSKEVWGKASGEQAVTLIVGLIGGFVGAAIASKVARHVAPEKMPVTSRTVNDFKEVIAEQNTVLVRGVGRELNDFLAGEMSKTSHTINNNFREDENDGREDTEAN